MEQGKLSVPLSARHRNDSLNTKPNHFQSPSERVFQRTYSLPRMPATHSRQIQVRTDLTHNPTKVQSNGTKEVDDFVRILLQDEGTRTWRAEDDGYGLLRPVGRR